MDLNARQREALRPCFVAQLETAATASGVELRWLSDGWIALLHGTSRHAAIMGYTFPLNNAAAAELANDKVATFDVLRSAGIPAVQHALLRFNLGTATSAVTDCNKHTLPHLRAPVVIKPLDGSGGKCVRRALSDDDLAHELAALARSHRAVAVSPWIDIDAEVRVVLLDSVVHIAFVKQRPAVGSYREWRHNLRCGALPHIVEFADLPASLTSVARSAAAALGLRFAAVDLVSSDGMWKILEVNSGVCLERFSATSTHHYLLAERVYTQALSAVFT